MKNLIHNKYRDFETSDLVNKVTFLTNKIEIVKKDLQRKIKEMESMCIEVLEINDLIDERQNKVI